MEQLSINATGCDVCTDKSTDETGEAYCKDHNNKVISTKPLEAAHENDRRLQTESSHGDR
jgi:hypothetical protein